MHTVIRFKNQRDESFGYRCCNITNPLMYCCTLLKKTYFLTSHGQLCAPSSSPAGAEDFPLVAPAPAFSILMLEARKFDQEKFGPDPKAGTHPWLAMASHDQPCPAMPRHGRSWLATAVDGRPLPAMAGHVHQWLAKAGRQWPAEACHGRSGINLCSGVLLWTAKFKTLSVDLFEYISCSVDNYT